MQELKTQVGHAVLLIDSLSHSINDIFTFFDTHNVAFDPKITGRLATLRVDAISQLDTFGLLTDTPAENDAVTQLRAWLKDGDKVASYATMAAKPVQKNMTTAAVEQEALTTRQAEADDIVELRGRMYESIDIQLAIENDEVTSLDQLAKMLEDSSGRMDRTIKAALAGEPLVFKGAHLVLKD